MTAQGDALNKAREEGREEGRIAEILRRHELHFQTINGSIESSKIAMVELASEVRGMREDARIAAERVIVAADTLATETERRREELAGSTAGADRKFTRRERIAGLALTAAAAAAAYVIGK